MGACASLFRNGQGHLSFGWLLQRDWVTALEPHSMDKHSDLNKRLVLGEDNFKAFAKPPEPIAFFTASGCSGDRVRSVVLGCSGVNQTALTWILRTLLLIQS